MDLESANRAIKAAWVMALISAGVSVTLTVVYASGGTIADIDFWNWVDIVVLLGGAVGIYMKSRVSAGAVLIYYTASKLIAWLTAGALIGVPMSLIFIYFFFQGFRGTMAYHQLKEQAASA